MAKTFKSVSPVRTVLDQLAKQYEGAISARKDETTAVNARVSLKFVEGLVSTIPENPAGDIFFATDPLKSFAVVIGGESGSGKTFYATRQIPKIIPTQNDQNVGFIYRCLPDGRPLVTEQTDQTMSKTIEKAKVSRCMWHLETKGKEQTKAFTALAAWSDKLHRNRNDLACAKVRELVSEGIPYEDNAARTWWTAPKTKSTLEGLVIILDEMGKDPELCRGVVASCRRITQELAQNGKSKSVLLVLVGTGLDSFRHRVQISKYTFGTDPARSRAIVMRTPTKAGLQQVIDPNHLGGTYARYLADNTRMLMHAIVPTLTIDALRLYYKDWEGLTADEQQTRDRREAGSCRGLMNYAFRCYTEYNGMQKLDPEERVQVFATQFKYFLRKSLTKVAKESENEGVGKDAQFYLEKLVVDEKILETLFALGLATETTEPSSAMKFLACTGMQHELLQSDGLQFEDIVEEHVFRLCQCMTDTTVERYNLKAAWPPCGSEDAFSSAAPLDSQDHKDDIKKLSGYVQEALRSRNDWKICVLRQSVPNAQGADGILMVADIKKKKVQLHFAQMKNCKQSTIEWSFFLSLGMEVSETGIDFEPKNGFGGYSFSAMTQMAEQLQEALQGATNFGDQQQEDDWRAFTVEIGERAMILSTSYKNLVANKTNASKVYALLSELQGGSNVFRFWPREFLYPSLIRSTDDDGVASAAN
ncbi:MAG: hypothetical protein SGARI_001470 [Bacillariaceae sp.]